MATSRRCTIGREGSSFAMNTERYYAVDQLKRRWAVVIDDEGRTQQVSRGQLPSRLTEGDVLRVPLEEGHPDWGAARVDPEETERRRREAQRLIDRLRERDPGGDIEL